MTISVVEAFLALGLLFDRKGVPMILNDSLCLVGEILAAAGRQEDQAPARALREAYVPTSKVPARDGLAS